MGVLETADSKSAKKRGCAAKDRGTEIVRMSDVTVGGWRVMAQVSGEYVTGLWLEGQDGFNKRMREAKAKNEVSPEEKAEEPAEFTAPVEDEGARRALEGLRRWLKAYDLGKEPDFTPLLKTCGTAFQERVWALLLEIPYGETVTYGHLAELMAAQSEMPRRMSAQAIGGAVGRNPISLIIPCHRVIGADGSLTGYQGGVDKKEFLLKLEGSYDKLIKR